MFDAHKIDDYFVPQNTAKKTKKVSVPRRVKVMHFIKLALPCFAAMLIGVLIITPHLKKNINDLKQDAIQPRKGELEKFHMENGIFYITDYKNMVNNFNADSLDETEAGSKIIKMINPRGKVPTSGEDEVSITAPLGFYNQNTKMLTLQQGVHLDYSRGLTTDTEEMFFDFNEGKAYGIMPILTKSETAEITANGFEYYKDKNLLIYTGKTHITIQADNIEEGF